MAKELEIISLQDIIPSSIAYDKNVQAIIQATDPEFKKVSQDTREAFIISRINELPENVINLLAWQWHVDFYEPDLPITTKRELVLDSIKWHRKKGTKASIESALKNLDSCLRLRNGLKLVQNRIRLRSTVITKITT